MFANREWRERAAILLGFFAAACYQTGTVATPSPCSDGVAVLAETQLYACARQTAVKIINGNSWGSGTIVWQQGDRYGVLTNAHVLQAAELPAYYCVQTADDRVHPAIVSAAVRFPETDLALLEFRSSVDYVAIRLASGAQPIQQEVAVVGFPFDRTGSEVAADGFAFERATVRRQLVQPLQDGYQIGYDGWVGKGMSGGAVLGMNGEALAINGWHAYPLWTQSFVYRDGSTPSPQLQSDLERLNWGIPVPSSQVLQAALVASIPPRRLDPAACANARSRL